jgi:hypothetical protein
MASTLAQLRTEVRTRADITYSNTVADSELTVWINDALRELHTLLGAAYPDRYLKFVDFTISSGTTFDPLTNGAADFWKIRGVDADPTSSRPRSLKRVTWNERNRTSELVYRDRGHLVEIFPTTLAAGKAFRLWYLPKVVTLSADGDLIDQCQEDCIRSTRAVLTNGDRARYESVHAEGIA